MSYENEIQAMRDRKVEPAPFETLVAKQAATPQMPRRRLSVAAASTAIALLAFLALFIRPAIAAGSLYKDGTLKLQIAALLPVLVLTWAFRRLSEPRLGAQLLSRAVWWSSLVVGLLVSLNYGETPDKVLGSIIAVACAVALLSVGERGLEIQEPGSPFAPVRFRGHLLLALVMAAADALTLAFSGLLQLRFGKEGWTLGGTLDYAGPTIAAAVIMGFAVWGVYRLRTWALFLNLVANITIAYLALEGTLGLSPSVSITLATTAAIQCFIPVPILAAAAGDRNAGQPLLHALRHRLMSVTVLALAALSILAIPLPGGDGWVDGPGRAFVRGTGHQWKKPRSFTLRLLAMDGDLRDVRLDGRSLLLEDFSGFDLRGASLRSTLLKGTNLADADLRGVDFTKAEFGDFRAESQDVEGAVVHGADFTGAFVAGHTWEQLAVRGLDGVRCPDGTTATPASGCDGHLGHMPRGFRRVFSFSKTSTEGSFRCGHEGDLTVLFSEGEALWHRNDRYVQLVNGDFVSRFSRIHVLEDGRWEISSELCADNILLIPADLETAEASPPQ